MSDWLLATQTFDQSSRFTVHAIQASTTSSSSLEAQSPTFDIVFATTLAVPTQAPEHPMNEPQVCRDSLCRNGGTCLQLQPPGEAQLSCHCPLHFTGTFCEKGRLLHSPGSVYTTFIYTIHRTHTGLKTYCTVTSTVESSRDSQQIMLVNICWASLANRFHYEGE